MRTAPSLAAPATAAARPRSLVRPVLENVECLAIAIVMALILKFFLIEAYKIPTGSMQPTIIGDERAGIFDRVLVNKLVYFLRPPERYEVVVFKMPLVQWQNYIKRLIGLPGETVTLRNGDVFVTPPGGGEEAIARKDDAVWRSVRKLLRPLTDAERAPVVLAPEGGTARVAVRTNVRDQYFDGYDRRWDMGSAPRSATWSVSDIEVAAELEPGAGARTVAVVLEETAFRHTLQFDVGSGDARIESRSRLDDTVLEATRWTGTGRALAAGGRTRVSFRNVDDELVLCVGGDEVVRLPYVTRGLDPRRDPSAPGKDLQTGVFLEAAGGAVTATDVRVWRDVHYLPNGSDSSVAECSYQVPEGHYFVLGDNTQNSHDCRQWSIRTYTLPDGQRVRGHNFELGGSPDRNPQVRMDGSVAFTNLYGQRYVWSRRDDLRHQTSPYRSVPAEFFMGKALAVFWPIPPFAPTWRLKWVR